MPQSYSELYGRIQESFAPDELNQYTLEEWLMGDRAVGKVKVKAGFTKTGAQRYDWGGMSRTGLSNLRTFAKETAWVGDAMQVLEDAKHLTPEQLWRDKEVEDILDVDLRTIPVHRSALKDKINEIKTMKGLAEVEIEEMKEIMEERKKTQEETGEEE